MTLARIKSGILTALFAAAAVAAHAAAPSCRVDAATGAPIPQSVQGVCTLTTPDRSLFVQRSGDGLLIAEVVLDDSGFLAVRGTSARIVFCPTDLLDFASGAPTPACLASLRPLEPGPKALVGSGAVRADLRGDGSGGTVCPIAARVTGIVQTAAGRTFRLASSVATLDDAQGSDACTSLYDRIELEATGGPSASSPYDVAGQGSVDRQRRIEQLVGLDDDRWRVVELLLALTPRDWQALETIVRAPPDPSQAPGTVAAASSVEPQSLLSDVAAILARVNTIRSNLDSLGARIPDRGDVRDLLGDVDLSHLRDILGNVRDNVQGLLDIARELRNGYDAFDVVQFRARFGRVLGDLETATTLSQRLLCIDNPELTIRHVGNDLLKRLLDRAPGVTLYALSTVLESVDPEWDQRIATVISAIPTEVTGLCNDGARPNATARFDLNNTVCSALRHKQVGAALGTAKAALSLGLIITRFAKNHTKEDIDATAGAVAVAGGTGGTSVKNPVHTALEQWVDRLDNLKDTVKDIIDRRKDCLDADTDIENDLRDCAKDDCSCLAPLTATLPGDAPPTFAYIADLVGVRIGQAEAANFPDTGAARAQYNEAINITNNEKPAGYGKLCQAYRHLLVISGPPSEPPAAPPGHTRVIGSPRRH